ncbi:unnamed protein product, partial [Phaeothamnion confervicola]
MEVTVCGAVQLRRVMADAQGSAGHQRHGRSSGSSNSAAAAAALTRAAMAAAGRAGVLCARLDAAAGFARVALHPSADGRRRSGGGSGSGSGSGGRNGGGDGGGGGGGGNFKGGITAGRTALAHVAELPLAALFATPSAAETQWRDVDTGSLVRVAGTDWLAHVAAHATFSGAFAALGTAGAVAATFADPRLAEREAVVVQKAWRVGDGFGGNSGGGENAGLGGDGGGGGGSKANGTGWLRVRTAAGIEGDVPVQAITILAPPPPPHGSEKSRAAEARASKASCPLAIAGMGRVAVGTTAAVKAQRTARDHTKLRGSSRDDTAASRSDGAAEMLNSRPPPALSSAFRARGIRVPAPAAAIASEEGTEGDREMAAPAPRNGGGDVTVISAGAGRIRGGSASATGSAGADATSRSAHGVRLGTTVAARLRRPLFREDAVATAAATSATSAPALAASAAAMDFGYRLDGGTASEQRLQQQQQLLQLSGDRAAATGGPGKAFTGARTAAAIAAAAAAAALRRDGRERGAAGPGAGVSEGAGKERNSAKDVRGASLAAPPMSGSQLPQPSPFLQPLQLEAGRQRLRSGTGARVSSDVKGGGSKAGAVALHEAGIYFALPLPARTSAAAAVRRPNIGRPRAAVAATAAAATAAIGPTIPVSAASAAAAVAGAARPAPAPPPQPQPWRPGGSGLPVRPEEDIATVRARNHRVARAVARENAARREAELSGWQRLFFPAAGGFSAASGAAAGSRGGSRNASRNGSGGGGGGASGLLFDPKAWLAKHRKEQEAQAVAAAVLSAALRQPEEQKDGELHGGGGKGGGGGGGNAAGVSDQLHQQQEVLPSEEAVLINDGVQAVIDSLLRGRLRRPGRR